MPLVTLKEALFDADRNNYGIGAYNINNLNTMSGILEAAEELRSPVILAFAEVHFPYMDFELLMAAAVHAAHRASVPVIIHLDHGLSLEGIMAAIRYGASSVMVDASMYSLDENVKKVENIVAMCKPLGISVEAELGCIGGGEGDGSANEVDRTKFTDPDEAVEFVQRTGIDALAIAFGNVHGKYKDEPNLEFELLDKIRKGTQKPLVLHGGSGISDSDFQKAISLGIKKINFYTKSSLDSLAALTKYIETDPCGKGEDVAKVWNIVKQEYYKNAKHNMQAWNSAGKG